MNNCTISDSFVFQSRTKIPKKQSVKQNETESRTLSEVVVQGMLEKKAQNIVVLDLRQVKNAVADFFIICTGTSDTQVDSITDSIEQEVIKQTGEHPRGREGKLNKEWILLDYVDVVAHVFKAERRAFYALEELWGDAKIQTIGDSAA
jgi:ribosome-associated protein